MPTTGSSARVPPFGGEAAERVSAGYSGTPLPRKLGIKQGHQVLLAGASEGFEGALSPLPPAVRMQRVGRTLPRESGGAELDFAVGDLPDGRFDVVLLFCPTEADIEGTLPSLVSRIRWDGGLWVCWPKKSSPLYTDLGRERVREAGLATGLVDNKVCAVDEDWSGLRFVVRKEDRPKKDDDGGPG